MRKDLITTGGNKIANVIKEQGIGDIIKPLVKEIHLFDTFVAGTAYLEDKSVLEEIAIGDKLTLQREDNEYDEKAILVLNEERKKLGYVPKKDNIVFSRLMDAGKLLIARISAITQKGDYTKIDIGIYLVDF